MTREIVRAEDRKAALKVFPVLARERLSEPTYRMQEKLARIAEGEAGTLVLVRERDGTVTAETLSDVAERKVDELAYTLVLLPPGCGRLVSGMLGAVHVVYTEAALKDPSCKN